MNIQIKKLEKLLDIKLLNKEIVKNDFKVTFRPHPEYLKRFEKEFFKFTKNFSDFDNFITSVDSNNYPAMEKSEFLLTDWSGIAFEFAYAFKRPVVFLDAPKKILNTDFARFLTSIKSSPMKILETNTPFGLSVSLEKLIILAHN